jgi:hypothetical protein
VTNTVRYWAILVTFPIVESFFVPINTTGASLRFGAREVCLWYRPQLLIPNGQDTVILVVISIEANNLPVHCEKHFFHITLRQIVQVVCHCLQCMPGLTPRASRVTVHRLYEGYSGKHYRVVVNTLLSSYAHPSEVSSRAFSREGY